MAVYGTLPFCLCIALCFKDSGHHEKVTMKLKSILIAGAAVLLGHTLWQKAQAVKNLVWQVSSVILDRKLTGWQKTAFAVTIRIYNPTNTSVAFDRFILNFLIKGITISTIEANRQTTSITIAPGTTDVKMTAWVDNLSTLKELPAIIRQIINGEFNQAITATGMLYAGGITFPLEQNVSFGNGIGKARVSLEFEDNDAAAEYFQRSHIYVTSNGGKLPGYSVNGVKKKWQPRRGYQLT